MSAGIWTETIFSNVLIPSVGGKNFGTCGNDALYLQLNLAPTNVIDIEFILPAMYIIENITSNDFLDFNTIDRVESITNNPRTGDTRTSINAFSPYGWLLMNDGTIGSAASAATARANKDTYPLYDLIWRTFQPNQTLAPMSGGAYGANSFTDFNANRTLALTRNLGRVMAGALSLPGSQAFTIVANTLVVTTTGGFYTGMAVTVSVTGGALTAGVVYYAIVVNSTTLSLATTTANALLGTVIVLGAVPPGTITSVNVEILGSYIGEERHLQATNEVGVHSHTASFSYQLHTDAAGGTPVIGSDPGGSVQSVTVNNSAQNVPMNIIQPTVYMNVFIKL